MASDTKQAAERLRAVPEGAFLTVEQLGDIMELAHAYLALTDPTPIDEAWLRSVGLDTTCGALQYRNYSAGLAMLVNGTPMARMTRGQVRSIAMGFGIELTEGEGR